MHQAFLCCYGHFEGIFPVFFGLSTLTIQRCDIHPECLRVGVFGCELTNA